MFTQLKKISLPVWIFIGCFLGIFTGLFFGDYCSALAPIGSVYVMLLEIAVYPYIICSLLHGLASLSPEKAAKLFKKGWIFYVLVCVITFAIIFILSLLIPVFGTERIIHNLHSKVTHINLLKVIIPSNFFSALANNYIPAVVVFVILYGVAIQKFEKNKVFLSVLELIRSASVRLWQWFVKLAPFAVFALFAVTAGKMKLHDIEDIFAYVLIFFIGSLSLAFWILPTILASITPIRSKVILKEIQSGIILALATTISIVAIPFIIQATEKFLKQLKVHDGQSSEIVRTTISILYPIGQLGNFFVYFFIIFSVYFFQSQINLMQQFLLIPFTFLSCLGTPSSTYSAVVFLRQWLDLPAVTTPLYFETMAVTRYPQVLLSVMGLNFLTIAIILSYYGKLKIQTTKLIISILLPLIIFTGFVYGVNKFGNSLFPKSINNFLSFELDHELKEGINVSIIKQNKKFGNNCIKKNINESTFERIQQTGILKVGYAKDIYPFSYLNNKNDLVGYDISFAYALARDLNVNLEFVPINWLRLKEDLENKCFDIVMAGAWVTKDRLKKFDISQPYYKSPVSLLVPAKNVKEFSSREKIKKQKKIKIALLHDLALQSVLKRVFPNAEPVFLKNYSSLPNFDGYDAILWSLKQNSVLVSTYPDVTAISPLDISSVCIFAYLMPQNSEDFLQYVNYWLELKKAQGFTKKMKDHWINGKPSISTKKRWCIGHDVLNLF